MLPGLFFLTVECMEYGPSLIGLVVGDGRGGAAHATPTTSVTQEGETPWTTVQ